MNKCLQQDAPLHLKWHAMMEVTTTTIMCVVCEHSQTMREGRGYGWSEVVGGELKKKIGKKNSWIKVVTYRYMPKNAINFF